ncbi:MAG: hypothetical protein CR997_05800 [Acidobacteria bacterium]|nr:MAG: hypothetical protein CR997_05800 [Acidobacteriota bacterium]
MIKDKMKELPMELKDSVHKIWLAGLGAFSLAEEEGGKLFKELVEKGEKFEGKTEGTKQKVAGNFDQIKSQLGEFIQKFEGIINNGVSAGLSKVGVPSKEEIELLTKRVEELMNSVDSLKPMEKQAKSEETEEKAKTTRKTRTTRTRKTAASKE